MRLIRGLAIGAFSAAALVVMLYLTRDPEQRTLDDAARAGAPGRFVRLADGVTHYEVAGPAEGPVVLLTSGFSVPAYFSDSLFQQLGDSGFRVVRFDYYGRGWSDRPDIAYDLDLFSRQMDGLLDSLRVTVPVVVGGLSYGSAMAAHFMAQHPDRVAGIFFIGPVFNNRRPLPPRERSALAWNVHMVLRGGTEAMAAGQAEDFLHPEQHPEWVERYRVQQQFKGTREAWRRTRAAIATWPDQVGELRGLGTMGKPVLAIWGRQDPVAPIADSASLREAMPAAGFLAVDSAAHMAHMEQAPVVVPAVVRFLRAIASWRPLPGGESGPAPAPPGTGRTGST